MATFWFNQAKARLGNGALDLDTDTLKIMLLKGTEPTQGALEDLDDITAVLATTLDESDASGYTGGPAGTGRKTLTVTVAVDDTNNRANVTWGNVTWTAIGGTTNNTLVAALVYEHLDNTTDTNNIPIMYFDFTDTATNGGDITLSWSSFLAATIT